MTPSRVEVVCAVVVRAGRILLVRRAPGKEFGGLWCCPGGKVDAGETPARALVRELREEVRLIVLQGMVTGPVRVDRHDPPVVRVPCTLSFFRVEDPAGEPVAEEPGTEVGWFTASELEALPQTPGNLAALPTLLAELRLSRVRV